MNSRRLTELRLARLQKDLGRLRLGYARVLARGADVKGNLPAKILALKTKIQRLARKIGQRVWAA